MYCDVCFIFYVIAILSFSNELQTKQTLIIPEAIGGDRTRPENESCNEGELRAPRLLGSKATTFFLATDCTTGLSSCSSTAL